MQTSKLDRAGVFRFALNPADGGGSVSLAVASGDSVELGHESAGAYTKIGTYTADTSQTFPDSADFVVVRKMPGGTGISSVTVNDGAGSTGAPVGSTTPAAVVSAATQMSDAERVSAGIQAQRVVTNVARWGFDTAAVRAAYAATPTGGTLYFPQGATFTLKADSAYAACLRVLKAINIESDGALMKLAADAPTGTRMFEVTADDVSISGLSIEQTGVEGSTCVYASGAARLRVMRNNFKTPKSGALLLNDNVSEVLFAHNTVLGEGYGVLANDNPGIQRVAISANTFDGTGGGKDAVEINGIDHDKFDITTVGNTIANYQAVGPAVGFGIGYARVVRGSISGNVIRGCARNGIHIEANSSLVSVSTNNVSDCGNAGIEVQGELGKVCASISIADNTVSNCCLTPLYNLGNGGIEVGSSTGAAFTGYGATGISVSGNILEGNRGAGIYAFGVTHSALANNIVRNTYGVSTDTAHAIQNTGIYAISCTGTMVLFNQITDNKGAGATSYYPIFYYGASALLDLGNNWAGTLAGITDQTTGVPKLFGGTGVGSLRYDGGANRLGFFGGTPQTKPVVTGSKASGAAATSLLSALASLGLITDSSSA